MQSTVSVTHNCGVLAPRNRYLARVPCVSSVVRGFATRTSTDYDVGYAAGYEEGMKAAEAAEVEGSIGESVVDSMVKSITWRTFSTASTVAIVSLTLGDKADLTDLASVGGWETAFKLVTYFTFERVWPYLMATWRKRGGGPEEGP